MHRWDQRFAISPSKDNQHYHEFYRQYFDKPSGRKLLTTLPRSGTSSVSLRTTFGYGLQRMPSWSKAVSRKGKKKEKHWDDRFNVMWSKDNQHFHKASREYFDRYKVFDGLKTDPLPEMPRSGAKRSLQSTRRNPEAKTAWSSPKFRSAS